jgi:sigma-E factor negative regulatory protein RseA
MHDEKLKEKLSALVDNELDELDERRVFAALKGDTALRNTWERYHLMRAALRQDLDFIVPHDVAERVAQRIAAEPSGAAVFQRNRMVRFAGTLAIAASVAAIAIVGVQWIHQPAASARPQLASNKPETAQIIRSGVTRWDMKEPETESALNAYLIEHDEFSSTSGIGGMIPYVRVVTYDNYK